MLLSPPSVSTALLTYTKTDNVMAAEASDLPEPGRVWDDAVDVGYTVVSHHTGHAVVYAGHQVCDRDGDIVYWDYLPASRFDEGLPTLRVFND
jgi:hypothetical protein